MKRLPLRPDLLRAFLEGRKTVTRRLINPQPPEGYDSPQYQELFKSVAWYSGPSIRGESNEPIIHTIRPKYQPGDIVGIGEPWCLPVTRDAESGSEVLKSGVNWAQGIIHYLNDGPKPSAFGRVRTGRFLPDALVRHRARIVSVRAERLQEITEEDALREGFMPYNLAGVPSVRLVEGGECWNFARQGFRYIWDALHAKEAPWSSNPWVWRYEIARVDAGPTKTAEGPACATPVAQKCP